MNTLNPQSPFVWPEPRAIEEMSSYEDHPPFGELALRSHSLFGMVSALSGEPIGAIDETLKKKDKKLEPFVALVAPAATS